MSAALIAVVSATSDCGEAVVRALRSEDGRFDARIVPSVDALVELAASKPPDLALVDVALLSASPMRDLVAASGAAFPIVVLATVEEVPSAAAAMAIGASDYVLRAPPPWSELPHAVERALSHWQLQQRLRHLESLQKALVDSIGHAVVLTDAGLRITHWNKHSEDLFSLSAEAAMGRLLPELLRPSTHDDTGADDVVAALHHGMPWSGQGLAATRDGELLPVSLQMTPMVDQAGVLLGSTWVVHDMEGRLYAIEALRQAEARLGAVLRGLPALLVIMDTDLVVRSIEGSMLASLGLAREQVIGRSAFEFYTPHEHLRGLAARVLAGEEVCVADQFEHLWVDLRLTPLRDATGRVTGILALVTDVSERKTALDAARQSEERYRALLEAVPDGVLLLDADGRVAVANDEAARFSGRPRDALIGRTLHELIPADTADVLLRLIQEVIRSEENRSLCTEVVLSGSAGRWFDLYFAPVPDGVLCVARDVDERRRASKALLHAEARYRTVLEQVPAIIYSVARSPAGRAGFISPSVERVLGFTPEEWFSSPDFWETRLHPEDHDRIAEATRLLYDHGQPFSEEYRYIAKDGTEVWLHEETTAVPGPDPDTLYFHGVLTDITELKRVQDALARSQAAYELVVDSMAEGLSVMDTDGNYLFANRAQAALVAGGEPSAVIGHNLREYIPADQAEGMIERSRRVAESGRRLVDDVRLTTSLGDRWFHYTMQPISYVPGGPPAVLVFAFDITDRVEAEQAAREADARWQFALESSGDGVWDWDIPTNHVFLSRRWKSMLGYAEEDIGDRFEEWDRLLHPDDRKRAYDAIELHLSGKTPIYSVEYRLRAKDGTYRWILDRGKVIDWDTYGRPVRAIGTHSDITESKRAEQERLEMERRLLQTQKLESLGVLAGGAAHDYNNLLAAIVGNLEFALHELPPVSVVRLNIESAIASAQRAADLTRQMLAYAGRGRYVVEAVDLSALVEENARILRAAMGHNVTLNLDLDRGLPSIQADPGQVQQVLMNLVTNASEAIGPDHGVVTVSVDVRDCDEDCLAQNRLDNRPAPGRYVALEVRDTGCGMSEETKTRLFDPFFSTKFAGRGLGMSAVQGIVRGHGGAVLVKSEVGAGTTVTVLFPASGPTSKPGGSDAAETATPSPVRAGAVLVVDDEEIVRTLCARMVVRAGFEALPAADGTEALGVFERHRDEIVCVVLDMTMPGMDGVATFRALKQMDPSVKVIVATGQSVAEAADRFGEDGPKGFVQKPYRVAELTAELRRVVSGRG